MTPHETISLKIAELSASITSSLPSMPTLLRTIHANLKQDPELVTILSPEQVGIIVSGLMRQTQTTIATSVLSGGKGKALKKISLDDI
jgi:hypothetical protein